MQLKVINYRVYTTSLAFVGITNLLLPHQLKENNHRCQLFFTVHGNKRTRIFLRIYNVFYDSSCVRARKRIRSIGITSSEGRKRNGRCSLSPSTSDPLSLIRTTGAIAQSPASVHFYTHICLMFSRYFPSSLERPSKSDELCIATREMITCNFKYRAITRYVILKYSSE